MDPDSWSDTRGWDALPCLGNEAGDSSERCLRLCFSWRGRGHGAALHTDRGPPAHWLKTGELSNTRIPGTLCEDPAKLLSRGVSAKKEIKSKTGSQMSLQTKFRKPQKKSLTSTIRK